MALDACTYLELAVRDRRRSPANCGVRALPRGRVTTAAAPEKLRGRRGLPERSAQASGSHARGQDSPMMPPGYEHEMPPGLILQPQNRILSMRKGHLKYPNSRNARADARMGWGPMRAQMRAWIGARCVRRCAHGWEPDACADARMDGGPMRAQMRAWMGARCARRCAREWRTLSVRFSMILTAYWCHRGVVLIPRVGGQLLQFVHPLSRHTAKEWQLAAPLRVDNVISQAADPLGVCVELHLKPFISI
eukprot:gene2715-biopygen8218